MKILFVIEIVELETRFCGLRLSNRFLCMLFAFVGIFFAAISLLQHLYSLRRYNHIFRCRSDILKNATIEEHFLAYDIVIFDYGLMHRILGTPKCVANYLDGGYLRANWCIQHSNAMACLLLVLVSPLKMPLWLFWPALFMQSSYVLGMAILTMATTPKLLEALGKSNGDRGLQLATAIYTAGLFENWLFAFILWHYYWGIEELKKRNNRAAAARVKMLEAHDMSIDAGKSVPVDV